MPRFFTHILNDSGMAFDADGAEFADLPAATCKAKRTMGEAIADDLMSGKTDIRLMVVIEDGQGARVANLCSKTRFVSSLTPFTV